MSSPVELSADCEPTSANKLIVPVKPAFGVKVTTPETTLISDMSAGRAEALPVGARVTARVPGDEARLISLPDEGLTFSAHDLESQ